MFVSLGSIIGSGWLLGALNAAKRAGPASLISWVLAAVMLTILALSHAELGAAYPVTGGTARFPHFAFGGIAGFTAGWVSWLQAVALAPLEIEAAITYVNSVHAVHTHFDMLKSDGVTLNIKGLLVASLLMILFTLMNLMGSRFLSESNSVAVIWKFSVPLLTVVVIGFLSFHASNFTGGGGGFMPHGMHGVFQALSLGVVFALQGFEQCVQLAGEARNPQKDISRAIIAAMAAGALLYIALQFVFIGAVEHKNVLGNWDAPFGAAAASDYGAYYTLALAAGAGWLAKILIVDAVISPGGTGLVYIGTSARLAYAMGKEEVLPDALTKVSKRGIPWVSVLVAFVIGEICFAPFPSWNSMVNIITDATAIMYAFAPVSLAALNKRDPDRPRPYRMPWPTVLNPVGFISANLIIYWSGFDSLWKLIAAVFLGRIIFEVMLGRTDLAKRVDLDFRASSWIWPWLIGILVLSVMGRYGHGHNILPEWIDIAAVAAFSLLIFYWAISMSMSSEKVQDAVRAEAAASADPVLLP
jgi:amino acid transporter